MKITLNEPKITKKDIQQFKSIEENLLTSRIEEKFEKKIADFAQRKYAIAVNSGTAALHLALMALGIKEGDEVVCPSYTCVALLNAINYLKAKPKLVDCNFDIENQDFNISFFDLKKKITAETRAIIVPHMFGSAAEIDEITKLGIPIIEDATQLFGGFCRGKKAGGWGEASILSLHHSKMITAGSGGALLTDSEELYKKARFLGDYEFTIVSQRLGLETDYRVQYNYKMGSLNAFLGVSQISQISQFIEKRKEIAMIYTSGLKTAAKVPENLENSIFWRYIIEIKKDPKQVISLGLERGIEFGRGVYPSLHEYLGLNASLFPNTKRAISSVIAVPIYPSLDEKKIEYIIKTVKEIL